MFLKGLGRRLCVKKKKGELRINPKKSLQREKNYVRIKRERRGQFKLIRPRSQTTINTILPSSSSSFGLKVILYVQPLFLYARKLSLVFLFLFVRTNKAACPLYTYAHNFDGHHSSFNLAKICFVLRFFKCKGNSGSRNSMYTSPLIVLRIG